MASAPIHVQPAPVVVSAVPIPEVRQPHSKCYKGLAITQLVIGILCFIFGIAAIASLYGNNWVRNSGAGVWVGFWFGLTGLLGILSGPNNNSCLNGGYLALSIISSILAFLTGIFFVVAVAFYAIFAPCVGTGKVTYRGWIAVYEKQDCDYKAIGVGLNLAMLLLQIVEFFIAIVASCVSCTNGCCGKQNQTGVVLQQYPQGAMVNGGQGAPQYTGQVQPAHNMPPSAYP